jgi:hypothetical protein
MKAYILLGQSSGQGSSCRDRIISITWTLHCTALHCRNGHIASPTSEFEYP